MSKTWVGGRGQGDGGEGGGQSAFPDGEPRWGQELELL